VYLLRRSEMSMNIKAYTVSLIHLRMLNVVAFGEFCGSFYGTVSISQYTVLEGG
jgi:hypothetical protein